MSRNIKPIPFALPSIGKEEEEAVLKVLRSNWLTTGKITAQFEEEFAKKVGSKYAIAVNSATAGLHLSLDAIKPKENSFAITTPYTFTSTAEVARYINIDPLFVDITNNDYNIDPYKIEEAIKKNRNKISAIFPVHIAGKLCKIDEIKDIAAKYEIPVIEDCAHAFPVAENGKYAGTFGAAGVFSFYATKTISTGEGGMVVTDNDEIAARMKLMRLHGIDRDVWDRYTNIANKWYYEVKEPGFKYNLTDIASAIGLEQLKKCELFKQRRKAIAQIYNKEFAKYDFLTLPPFSENHCWHLYILRINSRKLSISRDEFINKLLEKGIGISVHFIPLHIMPYYSKKYNLKPEDFPNAMEKFLSSFSIPIYPGLEDDQIEYIINSIIEIGTEHYAPGRTS